MASLVVKHVALRSELLAAQAALERSFIVVDALVDSQVLLLREALAAALEIADEVVILLFRALFLQVLRGR